MVKAKKPAAKKPAAKKPAGGAAMRLPPPDPAVVAALDGVLAGRPDLRPGKMFGCPGYFAGAKAVASVLGADISLTLPLDEIEQRLTQPGFRRFQAFGRTMSGWILLDKAHVATLTRDPSLIEHAVAHARSKAAR